MNEMELMAVKANAEKDLEPLFRVLKQTLLETYLIGYKKGFESAQNEKENDDAEPLVRLKPDAILKRRLNQKDFSVRTWNCLVAADVKTLGDLISLKKTDYLRLRGFGRISLGEIEDYATKFGYELKKF